MTVRTRIAPSPTGDLHIGHFRTVLYNYAFAKKNGGQFIVRVEDTDRNRYVEGALDRTLDVISDYGLSWDEGPRVGGPYAPYIQSECLERYKDYAHKLVESGHAYYCFCTEERLTRVREKQQKCGAAKTCYDKFCRDISTADAESRVAKGEKYVIRLRTPEDETLVLNDVIHGEVKFETKELDDPILLKSDGFPTYHLAVVVDDHLMNITHILRGIDWMPSTPIHILLYKAFGWEVPKIGHLPNVKEKGASRKLGKRFGSVSAREFLVEGYLPEAVNNFLMFVGWNPGTEKEIYTLDEFVHDFTLERVQKTDLVAFDREKLLWYNGYYIRNMSTKNLWQRVKVWAGKYGVDLLGLDKDENFNVKVLGLVQERMKKLNEFNDLTSYFYSEFDLDEVLLFKFSENESRARDILKSFSEVLSSVDEGGWDRNNLEKICHSLLEEKGYKPKEAFMTLRVALTGRDASPHIFDVLEALGKELSLLRVSKALV